MDSNEIQVIYMANRLGADIKYKEQIQMKYSWWPDWNMWLGAEIQDAEVETCGPFAGHREHTKSKSSHHPFQIITIPALRLSAEYLCPFQFQPYNH